MVYIYSNIALTQNLVPNPSFEEIVSCPEMPDPGQIHLAEPWFDPVTPYQYPPINSSSDLYNECAPSDEAGVPLNYLGFQYARTGKGYAGITFWESSNWREKIEVELTEPLIKDSTYCVSMYVVNKIMGSKYLTSTSNLGFLLTNDSLIVLYDYYTTPSIENNPSNIISDTVNWTKVGGYYTAKGGERFLTIANFRNNENSIVLDSNAYSAYYLIDDVCVSLFQNNKCSCEDEIEDELIIEEENIFPNVFTPNNDGVNDFWFIPFKNPTDYVIILNRWGNEIALLNQDNPKWDGNCKNKPCVDGTYFYKAFVNGKVKNGFIQLMR